MNKMTEEETKELLKKVYFDAAHAGSYSSPQKIYESLDKQISLSKIKNFLRGVETYTVQRNLHRKFKRNNVIAPFINYMYDMDTANMTFYQKNNDYVHILIIIDIFSRFIWTVPLKTLLGKEMAEKLKVIFNQRKPLKVRTDAGSDFVNKNV